MQTGLKRVDGCKTEGTGVTAIHEAAPLSAVDELLENRQRMLRVRLEGVA